MSAPTHPQPPREKSLRPWILLAVIFVVVMVPLLILLHRFVNYRSGNAEAVTAIEAKIRANHEPLNLEELAAAYPPIPSKDNGAEVLLQLWEKDDPEFWHAFRTGATPLPTQKDMQFDHALPHLGSEAQRIDRVTALKPENVAAGNTYLEEQKEHLATVRTALGYSQFRFPIQLTNGFAMLIPHDAMIKREVINFRIEGLLAAERGDLDAAIGSLEDTAKTGKILASEPTLISQLVRIACYTGVLDDLQRLLSRQSLSKPQLARVDALLDQLQMPGALRMSLITERAADLSAFNLPPAVLAQLGGPGNDNSGANAQKGYQIGMNLLGAAGIKDADRRLILETQTEAIALADRDDPKSLEAFEQLFRDTGEKARHFPPRIFSAILLPALENAAKRFTILEARRRSAKLALGIERFRMSHNGNLPGQLEELVPDYIAAVPKDPFDGNPLHMKPLPAGFVVYSIGADRVDEGGKERPRPGSGAGSSFAKDYDETFIIER